nr:hypothetical protein [uncultured Holophaga sp.]
MHRLLSVLALLMLILAGSAHAVQLDPEIPVKTCCCGGGCGCGMPTRAPARGPAAPDQSSLAVPSAPTQEAPAAAEASTRTHPCPERLCTGFPESSPSAALSEQPRGAESPPDRQATLSCFRI